MTTMTTCDGCGRLIEAGKPRINADVPRAGQGARLEYLHFHGRRCLARWLALDEDELPALRLYGEVGPPADRDDEAEDAK